ncbi:VOC family protein [Mariniluteicoccus endophyticus]
MDPRLSFVTLAVADLAATRRFYLDGLGWSAAFDDGDEVVMVQVGERLVLSFWHRDAFAAEVGTRPAEGPPPITLAHNVRTPAEVDAALGAARAAGARDVRAAEHRVWGGYSGYFTDPDGFAWEVCWNPGPLGRVVVPDVDQGGTVQP